MLEAAAQLGPPLPRSLPCGKGVTFACRTCPGMLRLPGAASSENPSPAVRGGVGVAGTPLWDGESQSCL